LYWNIIRALVDLTIEYHTYIFNFWGIIQAQYVTFLMEVDTMSL